METRIAQMEPEVIENGMEHLEKIAKRSTLTCPECHGVLWEMQEGELLRFRCQVGHAYTVESMMADQSEALERALWAALRALEERADLSRRLAGRAREYQHSRVASRFDESAHETEEQASLIRQILLKGDSQLADTGT